ncbi:MAG: esterase [Sphingomonadales bacterium]
MAHSPELPALDGPVLLPASGGAPRALVILVHGYGANGEDLIGLAPHWQQALPEAAFIAPNAPERCPGAPMGYQWFGLTNLSEDERWRGTAQAAPVLDAFIDARLAEYGLDESRLVLVGFSQGTMMSLHAGLRRDRALAGILGYSGALVGGHRLGEEIRSRPPVQLIHGDMDQILPLGNMTAAAQALELAGVAVETHISHGVPHGIGPDGIEIGGRFLLGCLG